MPPPSSVDQQRADAVGLRAAGRVDQHHAVLHVDPHQRLRALRKGARQQRMHHLLLQLLGVFAPRAAAGFLFGLVEQRLQLALDHRRRHHLAFDRELQQPLAGDAFEQRPVLLAARFDPADRFRLRGAAGDETRRREPLFHVCQRRRLPLGDAENERVLEHETVGSPKNPRTRGADSRAPTRGGPVGAGVAVPTLRRRSVAGIPIACRAARQAAPGAGRWGGRRWRADSTAVLGWRLRRRTHFVRCAHCVQTAAADQKTKRAARRLQALALQAAPGQGPRRSSGVNSPPGLFTSSARLLVAPEIAGARCRLPLRA